jgi:4-aminobutyrate--pyruvate transaminase
VIELSERLVTMAPEPLAKVFFVNSGSEAIDTAIKLVWYYNNARGKPEKKRIIGRKRGYHGITLAAGHLTGLPYARAGFDLPMADRFFHVTAPSHYREGLPGEGEEAFADRLAAEVETLIRALGPETVAAFFAEPVMGAGGVVVPPKGYFEKVQAVLKKYDVLFVADEVICGFCRTGNMFGCDTYGIRPDLMTCAKQLSSAYLPIAALLMSDEFYGVLADQSDRLGNLGMGYTYGGHPVAAAVALETLKIYESDRILDHVREISPRFQARLKGLERHELVGEARGVGLIGGIEIVRDKATRGPVRPEPEGERAGRGEVPPARAHGAAAAGRLGRDLPAADHQGRRDRPAVRPARGGADRLHRRDAAGGLSPRHAAGRASLVPAALPPGRHARRVPRLGRVRGVAGRRDGLVLDRARLRGLTP